MEQSEDLARVPQESTLASLKSWPHCDFCEETRGISRCDWPTLDFVAMRVRDLQVGDQVRRFNQTKAHGGAVATVVELQNFYHGPSFGTARRIVLEISGPKKYPMKVFTAWDLNAIRIKREHCCGAMCCALHCVERGPKATYCRDHWKSWEVAA